MEIDKILKLSEVELAEYCLSLEEGADEGWEEIEREGYTLSYQFNEHSDHDSMFLPLNEIEPGSIHLEKTK